MGKSKSKSLPLQIKMNAMNKVNIYLDDVRTPVNAEDWVIVRNFDEFISKIEEYVRKN